MTMPDERYRSVMQTLQFLTDLCTTDGYKRVPKEIRQEARRLLRHYPSAWDMKQVAATNPNVFQERIEPLTRMIMVYDKEQKEEQNDKTI